VRDPEVFRRAARRAAAAGKAVVVLKAGSSELSARTAAAHTGALVGDDRVIDAIFADLGVIRVDSIEDMLITAGAAAALGRLEKPGIGIVSISGGACDIVADRAEDLGARLPEIAEPTRAALGEIMPDYGTVQNPLDVTGAAVIDPTIFTRAIGVMSQDPAVGVVGVINGMPWFDDGRPYVAQRLVDAIGAGMTGAAGPTVYINQVVQPITDYTRAIMAQAGVPYVIPGLRQAVVQWEGVGNGAGHFLGRAPAELEQRARQLVRRPFDLGHRAARVLLELLDLRLGVDVDAPARQLRRQAHVLALLADRERQLVVGNDQLHAMAFGVDDHA